MEGDGCVHREMALALCGGRTDQTRGLDAGGASRYVKHSIFAIARQGFKLLILPLSLKSRVVAKRTITPHTAPHVADDVVELDRVKPVYLSSEAANIENILFEPIYARILNRIVAKDNAKSQNQNSSKKKKKKKKKKNKWAKNGPNFVEKSC
jgi:H+/gluconate symporter-like permease